MSKSLGNGLLIKDMVKKIGGNVLRWAFLTSHYRAPLNFSDELVETARTELNKVATSYKQACVKLSLLDMNESNATLSLSDPYSAQDNYWATGINLYTEYPYYWITTNKKVGEITNMTVLTSNNYSTTYTVTYNSYEIVDGEIVKGNYIEDIYHISSSAFPTNGVQNGYWYVSQGQVTE